jgi:hypothetical protein
MKLKLYYLLNIANNKQINQIYWDAMISAILWFQTQSTISSSQLEVTVIMFSSDQLIGQ